MRPQSESSVCCKLWMSMRWRRRIRRSVRYPRRSPFAMMRGVGRRCERILLDVLGKTVATRQRKSTCWLICEHQGAGLDLPSEYGFSVVTFSFVQQLNTIRFKIAIFCNRARPCLLRRTVRRWRIGRLICSAKLALIPAVWGQVDPISKQFQCNSTDDVVHSQCRYLSRPFLWLKARPYRARLPIGNSASPNG